MTYNMTSIGENTTGFTTFLVGVNNELMFGLLGVFLLIGIAVIVLMGFYASTRELKPSLIGTCWINLILTLIFAAIKIVPPLAIFVSIVLLGLVLAVPRD